MFGLISAGLGLASSIFGKKSAKKEAAAANQGFDYLKSNAMVGAAQSTGQAAVGAQNDQNVQTQSLMGDVRGTTGLRGALLGLGGDTDAADAAFDRYKGSTGYDFRVSEGMGAITGSRAAAGMLNSGATGKSLMKYGQNMASQEFGNYLGQVDGQIDAESKMVGQSMAMSDQYGSMADRGLSAAVSVGSAGGAAGAGKAAAIKGGTENMMSGIGGMVKGIGSIFGF